MFKEWLVLNVHGLTSGGRKSRLKTLEPDNREPGSWIYGEFCGFRLPCFAVVVRPIAIENTVWIAILPSHAIRNMGLLSACRKIATQRYH